MDRALCHARFSHPECKVLADEMTPVQFECGGALEQEMTFERATAFIRTARWRWRDVEIEVPCPGCLRLTIYPILFPLPEAVPHDQHHREGRRRVAGAGAQLSREQCQNYVSKPERFAKYAVKSTR